MKPRPTVWFCSSVGGGIFGAGQVEAWRRRGWPARLHFLVPLADYWRGKSAGGGGRLRLRWRMYAGYPLRFLADFLSRRGDLLVVSTNPFFLPALAAWIGRARGHRTIALIYDLYPEALTAGGRWSPRGWPARLCAALTRAGLRGCDATVWLGPRLRDHGERAHGPSRRARVIAVGVDASVVAPEPPAPLAAEAAVRFTYSGHLGQLHEWETLAATLPAAAAAHPRAEFVLQCDGPGAVALKKALEGAVGPRLRLGGTLEAPAWAELMRGTSIALVTMRPGAEHVVVPSKAYSAMACGQAVLAVAPADSDLAQLVRGTGAGWVVEPGDTAGLAAAVARAVEDDAARERCRRAAWATARDRLTLDALAADWDALFTELSAESRLPSAPEA